MTTTQETVPAGSGEIHRLATALEEFRLTAPGLPQDGRVVIPDYLVGDYGFDSFVVQRLEGEDALMCVRTEPGDEETFAVSKLMFVGDGVAQELTVRTLYSEEERTILGEASTLTTQWLSAVATLESEGLTTKEREVNRLQNYLDAYQAVMDNQKALLRAQEETDDVDEFHRLGDKLDELRDIAADVVIARCDIHIARTGAVYEGLLQQVAEAKTDALEAVDEVTTRMAQEIASAYLLVLDRPRVQWSATMPGVWGMLRAVDRITQLLEG